MYTWNLQPDAVVTCTCRVRIWSHGYHSFQMLRWLLCRLVDDCVLYFYEYWSILADLSRVLLFWNVFNNICLLLRAASIYCSLKVMILTRLRTSSVMCIGLYNIISVGCVWMQSWFSYSTWYFYLMKKILWHRVYNKSNTINTMFPVEVTFLASAAKYNAKTFDMSFFTPLYHRCLISWLSDVCTSWNCMCHFIVLAILRISWRCNKMLI